ncbi:MAG: hypothetical protein Kow002_15680 [Anaerolineales bacterium]
MPASKAPSRRDSLKLVTNAMFGLAGLLGLGGLARFFSFQPDPAAPSEFDLGSVDNYPPGSCTVRADIPAVIYNRAGELIAYSLSCTHLGCTLEADGAEFSCPCHGSRFDEDGDVLAGPAQIPLKKLSLERGADDRLKLYTGTST